MDGDIFEGICQFFFLNKYKYFKGTGRMIKQMVMVFISISMGPNIVGFGRKIYSMGKESKYVYSSKFNKFFFIIFLVKRG